MEEDDAIVGRKLFSEEEDDSRLDISAITMSEASVDDEEEKISGNDPDDQDSMFFELSPKSIRLNIGGKRFETSTRLLLGGHHRHSMLAGEVWKAWREALEEQEQGVESNFSEVFVDGNADRFQYCLDYIVMGRAVIPRTIPRESVLSDLAYYGIEISDVGLIQGGE